MDRCEALCPAHDAFLRIADGGARPGRSGAAQRLLLGIAAAADLELTHARSIELLHRGDAHFDRLLSAVESATREICVEMYQVRPDPIGWRMCSALVDAARRGVEVRLLLDRFGSSRIASWLKTLRRYGVDVRWYRPWRPWNNPFHRTHRKLVVIDGRLATLGGINFAAEFSEGLSGRQAWRDAAVWCQGPVAWSLRRQFDSSWRAGGGTSCPPLEVPRGSGTLVALCGPREGGAQQARAYRELIAAARNELLLATPYFLPDRALTSALLDAARRGVTVQVVVPRHGDIWWFKHGARRNFHRLLDAGVSVWERCDRMVHAKVAVVDSLVAAVGSTNLNRLSLYRNSETLMLTAHPGIVAEVRDLIAHESSTSADILASISWASHPERRILAEIFAMPVASML